MCTDTDRFIHLVCCYRLGTLITATRDKSASLVTAIASKKSVKLIDLISTRMLGQYGFLAKVIVTYDFQSSQCIITTFIPSTINSHGYMQLQVFSIFELCKASVDVVASSDVSVSMTLDPKTASSVDMDRLMVCILLCPSYGTAIYRLIHLPFV